MNYILKALIGAFVLFTFTSLFLTVGAEAGPPHHWGNKPSVKAKERSTGPDTN